MKKVNYFDDILKSAINDSVANVKTSRDIFNEAWSKKEQRVSKRSYFGIQNVKKVAVVAACCTVFSFCGVFGFSPDVRATTKEALKTIFVLDKSDNDAKVVEKSEDEIIEQENIGGVSITDSNKNEMEKKFGFTFNFPEKIGQYYIEKHEGHSLSPLAAITIYDIKYEDIQEMRDKFMKAIDDDKTFEELKGYNMKRYVSSSYVDNQGHEFYLYLSKCSSNSKMNIVKEVNIDNIKCRIVEKLSAEYNKKISENYWGDDMTKEPTSVDKHYYMKWDYDDIEYSIYIEKDSAVDATIQFAEEYIKILKQK